jgi:hypothetical protein
MKIKNKFVITFLDIVNSLIKEILPLIFGALITAWILYNRTRIRVPKELPLTLSDDNIIFYIYLISIYFTIIYMIIRPFIIKQDQYADLYDTFSFSELFKAFYENSMNKIYKFIDTTFTYITEKNIAEYSLYIFLCIKNCNHLLLFVIIEILPRLIILSTFILDILYRNKIHYFYFSLLLLIIPLSMKFILFSSYIHIKDQCDAGEENIYAYILERDIEDYLPMYKVFERQIEKNLFNKPFKYYIEIHPIAQKKLEEMFQANYTDLILQGVTDSFKQEMEKVFLHITSVKEYISYYCYKRLKDKYMIWMSLFITIVYAIGWNYVIFNSKKEVTWAYVENNLLLLMDYFSLELVEPFSGLFL